MSSATTAADASMDIDLGNRRFMEAFRRGDGAAIAALYTADGQLLPAHSDAIKGGAAIQRFWQGLIDRGVKEAILETTETETLGETAYEVGKYIMKTQGQVADSGKYVVVWKREEGRWKLHRDIWTTSQPAA